MAKKLEMYPTPVAANTNVQLRGSGFTKERSHLVTATPPVGPPMEQTVGSDREGELSASFYLYAPGEWVFGAALNRDADATELKVDVAG